MSHVIRAQVARQGLSTHKRRTRATHGMGTRGVGAVRRSEGAIVRDSEVCRSLLVGSEVVLLIKCPLAPIDAAHEISSTVSSSSSSLSPRYPFRSSRGGVSECSKTIP